MVAWHLADKNNRMYVNTSDNKKVAMPRYYKNKIYTDEQRKVIGIKTRLKMLYEQDRHKIINGEPDPTAQFEAKKAAFKKHEYNAKSRAAKL